MALKKPHPPLDTFGKRIRKLEAYIAERTSEEIWIEVDGWELRQVQPDFLGPDDEFISLRYANGNIALVAKGLKNNSKEWLAVDLPPGIRFALSDSLKRLKKVCDMMECTKKNVVSLIAELATVPTLAETRQGRYSAQSTRAQSRKQDSGRPPSANFSARSSMADLKNYLKSISKRR